MKISQPPGKIKWTSVEEEAELQYLSAAEVFKLTGGSKDKFYCYKYTVSTPLSGKLGTIVPMTLDQINYLISFSLLEILSDK